MPSSIAGIVQQWSSPASAENARGTVLATKPLWSILDLTYCSTILPIFVLIEYQHVFFRNAIADVCRVQR